jgi:alkylation response protein AidB-like acyl-CoA dehydrogenase
MTGSARPTSSSRHDGLDPDVGGLVDRLLDEHDPATTEPAGFWGAQYDLGLAWVHFPPGSGGVGAAPPLQEAVNSRLAAAGAPSNALLNFVGLRLVAATLIAYGTDDQVGRLLRPLFTCREIWCQLFSEPGAGSDLAALTTVAHRDGDEWVITGHKVWTSMAHRARWGILVARSEPGRLRHQGLTFFLVDMRAQGMDVRPLRQMSGEAEFSEVRLHQVRVPDAMRLGDPGAGWGILISTLMSERAHNGDLAVRARGQGPIAHAVRLWRRQARDDPVRRDQLMRLWVDAEVARMTALRAETLRHRGAAGPEGSILKLAVADLPQRVFEFCANLAGPSAMLISDYVQVQPDRLGVGNMGDGHDELDLAKALLNSRSSTIGGGTTEIQRNTIGERILGLPKEPRPGAETPPGGKDATARQVPSSPNSFEA